MISPIRLIRKAAEAEEIDYTLLKSCLHNYAAPRDVITRLLRAGDLIRVKKGLYVFGIEYAKRPYSLEILANLVYGPSYVSCEYALSFYGFIPESVFEVTSMTTERNKMFSTPVGRFSYKHLSLSRYQVGLTHIEVLPDRRVLMATPEKALADLLLLRDEKPDDVDELRSVLYDSYRCDPNNMKKLRISYMNEIAKIYHYKAVSLLVDLVKEIKKDVR